MRDEKPFFQKECWERGSMKEPGKRNEVVSFKVGMTLIDVILLFFSWFTLGGSALFEALHASVGVIQGLSINPHLSTLVHAIRVLCNQHAHLLLKAQF